MDLLTVYGAFRSFSLRTEKSLDRLDSGESGGWGAQGKKNPNAAQGRTDEIYAEA